LQQALNENHVRHLALFLPIERGSEQRCFGPIKQLARIVAIENSDPRAIHKVVVGAVVDENDLCWCEQRRRPRFDDT
jgi:hypothetical protein